MHPPAKFWLSPIVSLICAAACTTASPTPERAPERAPEQAPEPVPEVDTANIELDDPEPPAPLPPGARVQITSVKMIQDCPNKPPTTATPLPPARPSQGATNGKQRGPSSMAQPCTQSVMQLSLEPAGEAPAAIEIKAVRIKAAGASLATLVAREPEIWSDNRYAQWDQTLAPGAATKASYKLSIPDWSSVEATLGGTSYGPMFTLEIDVSVDGQLQTVLSPEFPRERAHVIVT